jgi:hypothetical protein
METVANHCTRRKMFAYPTSRTWNQACVIEKWRYTHNAHSKFVTSLPLNWANTLDELNVVISSSLKSHSRLKSSSQKLLLRQPLPCRTKVFIIQRHFNLLRSGVISDNEEREYYVALRGCYLYFGITPNILNAICLSFVCTELFLSGWTLW